MSIIIRLQSLPLLAKTEDIRHFFGDLRIPDGGVYITGGELGDAFIAFASDDDARLAMHKNGYEIMGAPVKLYLSSHSEMEQEIARIKKQNTDSSHQRSPNERAIIDDYDGSCYRSRSPRKCSKSSGMSSLTRRSRSRSQDRDTGMLSHREIKAEFEQNSLGEMGNLHQQLVVPFPNKETSTYGLSPMHTYNMNAPKCFTPSVQSLQHTNSLTPFTITSPMVDLPPPIRLSIPPMPSLEKPLPSSSFSPDNIPNSAMHERPNENLFVTLSGLDPEWGLSKLQHILSGIFIPDRNIKFELNNSGSKTGTAYIKLCNTHDFADLLAHKTYFYKYQLITVSVCPDHVFNKHFTCETPSEGSLNSERGIFYYLMKGLPVDVTSQDILDFFEGLEIIDLYIVRHSIGQKFFEKTKVTAFVAFDNKSDYQKALSKNGQLFQVVNRVTLRSVTQKKVFQWKNTNGDFIRHSTSFIPVLDGGPVPGTMEKPFCAALTGLPETVTTKKIFSFFIRGRARPGKIHISLDDKQQCDGRAFVEFKNSNILNKACKSSGKRIKKSVISIKQISYEEMLKILDSQKFKHNNRTQTNAPRSHTGYMSR